MRTLEDHKVNGLNEAIQIQVIDEPGQGGACHEYRIRPVNGLSVSDPAGSSQRARMCCDISFQNGPINEHGPNGISQEALLTVVIDRLRSFQAGPFACKSNADALAHIETGLEYLKARTRERMNRGVEGTNVK